MSTTKDALARLAKRTGTPLSSLVASFAILHEITALVPLVGVFCAARSLGAGQSAVQALEHHAWAREWIGEGERWADRVGRRYGIMGYDKGERVPAAIADAVLAYGVVKATLPLRIGLSLWLSPGFSRRCVDPVRAKLIKLCARK